jgi:Leucine-rich repeat (LRR) protein
MLKYANLSFNSIQDLNHVQKHRFLECLLVSNNAISSIDPIAPLKYLMVLDLSHNRIESLPLLEDMKIQELNLKGNMLRSLENIQSLTLLTSLDVSNNELCTVEPLQHCPQLSYLDVSGNKIPDVQDLLLLKPCETLKTLWILNTPVASDPVHRLAAIVTITIISCPHPLLC